MLYTIQEQKNFEETKKDQLDRAEQEEIKNQYDKQIYELDVFRSILQKVKGFDYRFPNDQSVDQEISTSEESLSVESESLKEKLQEVPSADPDEMLSSTSVRQLENLLNKKCKKCTSIKAPGSHHCSICKRCIARMDHHCPWVNNCVGYYN